MHILQTIGVIKRGIILIFIPLLTLSADVMHKFKSFSPSWGNVGVYHLDEVYDCHQVGYSDILRRFSQMSRTTSSTMLVFLSPQFLINHRNALDVFITCAQEHTLRVIGIDEAHIHVQHGTSFRKEIRALRVEFFRRVFGNQLAVDNKVHP